MASALNQLNASEVTVRQNPAINGLPSGVSVVYHGTLTDMRQFIVVHDATDPGQYALLVGAYNIRHQKIDFTLVGISAIESRNAVEANEDNKQEFVCAALTLKTEVGSLFFPFRSVSDIEKGLNRYKHNGKPIRLYSHP